MIIDIKINDLLAKKKKTKYWFIKNMEGGYQSLTKLMNNETTRIHFDTIIKVCELLECTPRRFYYNSRRNKFFEIVI